MMAKQESPVHITVTEEEHQRLPVKPHFSAAITETCVAYIHPYQRRQALSKQWEEALKQTHKAESNFVF